MSTGKNLMASALLMLTAAVQAEGDDGSPVCINGGVLVNKTECGLPVHGVSSTYIIPGDGTLRKDSLFYEKSVHLDDSSIEGCISGGRKVFVTTNCNSLVTSTQCMNPTTSRSRQDKAASSQTMLRDLFIQSSGVCAAATKGKDIVVGMTCKREGKDTLCRTQRFAIPQPRR